MFSNLHEYLVDDDERDIFALPEAVQTLLADGRTGQKAGAGFYKKVKSGGKSEILVLDLETLDYRSKEKVRFACTGKARKADKLADKLKAMVYGDDPASKVAWAVTADTLIYSAKRIPEIADDLVNIDNALRWGFGWGCRSLSGLGRHWREDIRGAHAGRRSGRAFLGDGYARIWTGEFLRT